MLPLVLLHGILLRTSVVAVATLEGLFPSVGEEVHLQVNLLPGPMAAVGTGVWLVVGMRQKVPVETPVVVGLVGTDVAALDAWSASVCARLKTYRCRLRESRRGGGGDGAPGVGIGSERVGERDLRQR